MSKRSFSAGGTGAGFTGFTAQAYTANLTTLTYMALKAQSAQLVDVLELQIGGMATSSQVAAFQMVRASTVETGAPSALTSPCSDGLLLPSGTALASTVTPFVSAATNGPQASAAITDAKIQFPLNVFGGILRWNAAPTQQWQIVGTAAPGIESILFNSSTSGGSGSTLANAHIIYEPY